MIYEEGSPRSGRRSLGDRLSRRLWPVDSETLCEEARRRTRLKDFGDPPIEPALSILVNSLELEADLHPLERFLMRAHLRELLETRLRLTLTGMPRSGSTFLYELLGEDSQNRVPRVWEVMFPIPGHNSTRSKVEPRVRKAESFLWWFRREGITSFREAHPELDGRFIDVKYHELVSNPLTVVRQIYQRLDMLLTRMAAERMQRLASRRSRYKGRRGDRKPADFELDGTIDRHRLEAYCPGLDSLSASELSRRYA